MNASLQSLLRRCREGLGLMPFLWYSGTLPFWGKSKDQIFSSILRSKPDFSRSPWPTISDGAKHLIRLMLTANPARRATPADVMKHPWVEKNCAAGWNRSKSMPTRNPPLHPPTSFFQCVLPRPPRLVPPPPILVPPPPLSPPHAHVSPSKWDLPAPLGWNARKAGTGSQRSDKGGSQRLDNGQGTVVGEAGRVGGDGGYPDAIPAEYTALLAALTLSHARNSGQAPPSPLLSPRGGITNKPPKQHSLPPRKPKTPKGRYHSPRFPAVLEYPMSPPPPPTSHAPPSALRARVWS